MTSSFTQIPIFLLAAVGLIAVCLTSFLSAVEISVSRLTRARINDLIEEGRRGAAGLLPLVENRGQTYLALRGTRVMLQTIAIVSFTIALVGAASRYGWSWWVVLVVALVLIGLIEFWLVSFLPMLVVSRRYVGTAIVGSKITGSLVRVSRFFDPPRKLATKGGSGVEDADTLQRLAMAEDLRELADEVGETEIIDQEDRQMLRSVFEFGQTLVREVMVPRTSMITIDADKTVEEAVHLFLRSGFSRIPVIGRDVDDVVGILYLKDVVRSLVEHPDQPDFPVIHVARPPVFIPEMRLTDDEMRDMQTQGTHLALVVDEYGGIAGLVTMEDLLEELVGELKDEHDRFEMEPEELEAGVWRVPSRFHLGDLSDLLGAEIVEETVDSVGGLLGMALGRVPLPGDRVSTHGVTITAEDAVGRRRQVGSVLVQKAANN